jgi:hypothetical protein
MTDEKTPEEISKLSKTLAMNQVEANAKAAWKELILDIVWDIACETELFTTDEVCIRYRSLPKETRPDTHEWRALGPQMSKAAKLGYIIKTPYTRPSTDGARRHAAPLQIWRSLIFGGKKHASEI